MVKAEAAESGCLHVNTIQYKFISISAKYNAFGYIQYKAI